MVFSINLTIKALEDIQSAVGYYNSRSANLGYRFADDLDDSFLAIARMPFAYSFRYKNIRAKLLSKFPFLIYFVVDERNASLEILRIFNTYQEPPKY